MDLLGRTVGTDAEDQQNALSSRHQVGELGGGELLLGLGLAGGQDDLSELRRESLDGVREGLETSQFGELDEVVAVRPDAGGTGYEIGYLHRSLAILGDGETE